MVELGTIVRVDTEKYLVDVSTFDGRLYQNVPIGFVAGVDGVYGLTLIPGTGQQCVILHTEKGIVVLPILIKGNADKGANPERKTRKEKGQIGELILSLPNVIGNVSPDGFAGLYIGDFKDYLSSLEVDAKSTRLKSGNILVVGAGLVFKHEFDEEARIARSSYTFLRDPEGTVQLSMNLEDVLEVTFKQHDRKLFYFASSEKSIVFETEKAKLEEKDGDIELKASDVMSDLENVKTRLQKLEITGNSLLLSFMNANIRIDASGVTVTYGGNVVKIDDNGIEITAPELRVNANRMVVQGDVQILGNLEVSQKVEANAVEARTSMKNKGDDVVLKQPALRAFGEVTRSINSIIECFVSHTHPSDKPIWPPVGTVPTPPGMIHLE